jgi:hypothetical protein
MTTSRLGNQFVFLSEDRKCRLTITALDPNQAKEVVREKISDYAFGTLETNHGLDLNYWLEFQDELREKWF